MRKNVYIIAEAGVNHNGDIEIAKKLIEKGAEAGVDAVKFQTFKAEKLVTKSAPKAEYQKSNQSNSSESQYQMIKKLELDYSVHQELIEHASKFNVEFLSSAFDLESIDLLNIFNMSFFKIPSGEITNYPYLKKIAQTNKKILLSTGMSTLVEIEEAIRVLKEFGKADIIVLHCNTEYPTPMKDVNLNVLKTFSESLNVEYGYSDHTLGIEIPIAAVALGAIVIEKHFTLDNKMSGPDHKASLEPSQLKDMVTAIRNIELALGSDIKEPTESEKKNILIARKSIVAKGPINKGTIFTEENLDVKRPGSGLNPMNWDNIIGQKASKDFVNDELITL